MKPSARRDEVIGQLIELFLRRGFSAFSIEDLARELKCSKSTLYLVDRSKEQIITVVVRAFFRRATDNVESRMRREREPIDRIGAYLVAISEELQPASAEFFTDLEQFTPTREIYRNNIALAAERVRGLVVEAAPEASQAQALFVGAVAGVIMEAIHNGQLAASTRMDDPAAYRALAQLIVAGATSTMRDA